MQVKSAETSILCTLADSVNFSCSGLLCSSYSTTPSGPLADAGLPSPTAPPRLPLAASSWVSRRLQGNRISLRYGCRLILCWLCCCSRTLVINGFFQTSFHILAISLRLLCFTTENYSLLVLDYLALQQNYASNKKQFYIFVLILHPLISRRKFQSNYLQFPSPGLFSQTINPP